MIHEKLEETFEKYKSLTVKKEWGDIKEIYFKEYAEEMSQIGIPTLSNQEIKLLWQKLCETENTETQLSAAFITKAIQTSYDAGYNHFLLDTGSNELECICKGLKGKKENKIEITIEGDAGKGFGDYSKHCIFNITGNASSCCENISDSTVNVKGNAKKFFAHASENSIFNVFKSVGSHCGKHSYNSLFNIHEEAGEYCGYRAEKSIFNIKGKTGKNLGIHAVESEFNLMAEIGDFKGYSVCTGRGRGKPTTYKNIIYSAKDCIFNTSNIKSFEKLHNALEKKCIVNYIKKQEMGKKFQEHQKTKKMKPIINITKLDDLIAALSGVEGFHNNKKPINPWEISKQHILIKENLITFYMHPVGNIWDIQVKGKTNYDKKIANDKVWKKVASIIADKYDVKLNIEPDCNLKPAYSYFMQKQKSNIPETIPTEIKKVSEAQKKLENAIENAIENEVKAILG